MRRPPLRALFRREKVLGHVDEPMLSVFRDHGVIPKDEATNFNKTAEDRSIYQLVEPGWLVVNRMKAWQGSVGISGYRGIVSGHYICFRPTHSEHDRYLNWLFRSGPMTAQFGAISRGVRPGQIEIDNDDLASMRVPMPPIDEQRRIADFLDDQVARIDAASQSRAAQIQSIGDLATAQIEGAIDDLGIANGWRHLRRSIRRIEQGWSPQCEAVPAGPDEWGVLKVGAVRGGAFHSEQNKRLPDDLEPQTHYEVAANDLVFSRANTPALVGEAAVVPAGVRPKLILCDKLFRVELEDGVSVDYVATVAGTARSRAHFTALSSGTSGSMVNIRAEDIQGLAAPDASLAVQTCVADYARRTHGGAAAAISALARSIDLLNEYKRSLITAAVTGEFDVTTARTGIPA